MHSDNLFIFTQELSIFVLGGEKLMARGEYKSRKFPIVFVGKNR